MVNAAGEPFKHDYIETQDLNGNRLPDALEPGGGASNDDETEMRDQNRNGIPDYLEPFGGSANDDNSVEFDSNIHRNDPLDRTSREASGVVGATFEPIESAEDIGRRTDRANAEVSKIFEENEANPNKTKFGKDATSARLQKLRKKRLPRSSIARELSRIPSQKEDTENGLALAKKVWQGMLAGARTNREYSDRERNMKIDQEIKDLERAERDFDNEERRRAAADQQARQNGKDKPESTEPGNDGPSGPEHGGPNQSGPSGSENGGPGGTPPNTPINGAEQVPSPQAGAATDSAAKDRAVTAGPVTGNAGLGMAISAVNPVAGAAFTSIQTTLEQKEAGASHLHSDQEQTPTIKSQKQGVSPASTSPSPQKKHLVTAPNVAVPPHQNTLGRNPNRQGALYTQARALAPTRTPTLSIGPQAPAPRIRVAGLGTGIGSFISAARALAPRDQNYELGVSWMKSQRDSEGRGR